MKKTVFNPYLPSYEYIPDGEPHVFDGRLYVFGSHDAFGSHLYCVNDYVCWSAPVSDLSDWRYEGVIYRKTDDPSNQEGDAVLYAPDVTRGPDGRYYLYYVLDKVPFVSVAICDTPCGRYRFYGYVKDKKGGLLGTREQDEPAFDPGVLTEGDETYLYTGFSPAKDASRHGAFVTVLEPDMLTIRKEPAWIVPGGAYAQGSGYEGHAFFEASSMRKRGDTYYFIYSSELFYELCYAVGPSPLGPFRFGGTVISNNDMGIASYKPAVKPMACGGNNHGSIVSVGDNWYVFYHRHTNGSSYSRQGCAEKLVFRPDGSIVQAEMTSCGLSDKPLSGKGEYPAYAACHLYGKQEQVYTGGIGGNGLWVSADCPIVTQEGSDEHPGDAYLLNLTDGASAGFRYFDFSDTRKIAVWTRGYAGGCFEIRNAWDGDVIGTVPVPRSTIWTRSEADVKIPDGAGALYFTYSGRGTAQFLKFELI